MGETAGTDLLLLNRLVDEERRTERGLLRDLRKGEDVMRMRSAVPSPARGAQKRGPRTCFASTACVNSGEKATCVIETSSSTRLKRNARRVRFSRTSRDTCGGCGRRA